MEDKESLIDDYDFIAQLTTKSEKEIAETLGKNQNAFISEHGFNKDNPENMKQLVKLILNNETLKNYIDNWRNQSDKNKVKTVKLIDKYQS
ncbi:hypothetical protein MIS45_05200 [Wielerella bovis]|uniref:hypothetical protein n=1 Tax=Wielerella bovis TaxID=2917790 RepID=UPI002018C921|nr:hypothetical protein [Wielerella bovis]ULJ70220.1 hypothetical protein MIS45_05200 [Wielerella bovis]